MSNKVAKETNENFLFTMPVFDKHLLTIKEASAWASNHLGKNVTTSNISYLIQYGRIKKFDKNGTVFVSLSELKKKNLVFDGRNYAKR